MTMPKLSQNYRKLKNALLACSKHNAHPVNLLAVSKTQQIERNIIRKPDYPFEFDKTDFVRCIARFVIIGMHINLHPGDVWNVESGKGNII